MNISYFKVKYPKVRGFQILRPCKGVSILSTPEWFIQDVVSYETSSIFGTWYFELENGQTLVAQGGDFVVKTSENYLVIPPDTFNSLYC